MCVTMSKVWTPFKELIKCKRASWDLTMSPWWSSSWGFTVLQFPSSSCLSENVGHFPSHQPHTEELWRAGQSVTRRLLLWARNASNYHLWTLLVFLLNVRTWSLGHGHSRDVLLGNSSTSPNQVRINMWAGVRIPPGQKAKILSWCCF